MRKYAEAKGLVRIILDAQNLTDTAIHPGPDIPEDPDNCVILTRYPGPGLDAEGALDVLGWQVRAVGKQGDYESAESIADFIDDGFLNFLSSYLPDDGRWVVTIARVGGAPSPLLVDDADRTHFVCSYYASVQTALSI